MRRLLLITATAVLALGFTPAQADADAEVATCGQAVQKPFTIDRLTMHWGTLVACGSPIASATFTGQLQTSGGVPIDTKAGTVVPPGGTIYFWMNQTVCPLPGSYRSVILTATIVLMNGTIENLTFQDSGPQFVDCIL